MAHSALKKTVDNDNYYLSERIIHLENAFNKVANEFDLDSLDIKTLKVMVFDVAEEVRKLKSLHADFENASKIADTISDMKQLIADLEDE